MAELKRFEYIIELEPFALQNDDEICFKSRHAQKLIRCSDCRHRDPEDKKCDCGGIEDAKDARLVKTITFALTEKKQIANKKSPQKSSYALMGARRKGDGE